jgi:hypothetical protein
MPQMTGSGTLHTGERLIQTIWVGSLWCVGYLVAPALFAHLDSREAGRIAGELFTIVAWLSVACGALLVIASLAERTSAAVRRRFRVRLIGLMVALIALGEWVVRPVMEAARLADGSTGPGFGLWHGLASVLYLMASLGGVWLVAAAGNVSSEAA